MIQAEVPYLVKKYLLSAGKIYCVATIILAHFPFKE
jgi:hypothetical protein